MFKENTNPPSIENLFPEEGRALLSGSGKEFVERIGIDIVRHSILSVMIGDNIRTQTEPLSRRKIAIVSGAIIKMFARGCVEFKDFPDLLSNIALQQITVPGRASKINMWIAQWLIGLTQKQFQNVLRSNSEALDRYVADFESAIEEAAAKCGEAFGELKMSLDFTNTRQERPAELDWKAIARLTTAIGSQTLALRGSDKSMYGKLFERLILGSFLTILGFERVNPSTNTKSSGVFWLSDSRERESDATLLIQPGKVVRFDIGFIGAGNSEISKDKLSRYARELDIAGISNKSTTFVIVDRLPRTVKTQEAAALVGAEIVQMSMQYWVRELSQRLGERFGIQHELQSIKDDEITDYLLAKLSTIPVQDFLSGISAEELQQPDLLGTNAIEDQ